MKFECVSGQEESDCGERATDEAMIGEVEIGWSSVRNLGFSAWEELFSFGKAVFGRRKMGLPRTQERNIIKLI